jgi:hypothetical protein
MHVMLNAYWEPLTFELPPLPAGERWHRIVDTALPTPDDFSDPEAATAMDGDRYRVEARSAVMLMARASPQPLSASANNAASSTKPCRTITPAGSAISSCSSFQVLGWGT